jgi:dipeptidyl aminopeptidase/acylaminoacyl peptidase
MVLMQFLSSARDDQAYIEPIPRYISAISEKTKQNGLFELDIKGEKAPLKKRLASELSFYEGGTLPGNLGEGVWGSSPLKNKNGICVFVVQKSNYSPNLFATKDFSHLIDLSDIRPEKRYNWLNSELVQYTLSDNRDNQGILYKPENFSPDKKYPMLVTYYEHRSSGVNMFIQPEFSMAGINIPWFVSRGYLVFVPDVDHYTYKGEAGRNVLDAVISGVNFLSKTYSFIDSARMGLAGHSHGGYKTNFLVAHSKIFSAALSASGQSDPLTAFGQLTGRGTIRFGFYETIGGQGNYSSTPWEDPMMFVKNSAFLRANSVTTPLLLMHGTVDGAVPIAQSISFFAALRRFSKKVWLLEYKGMGHGLSRGMDVDYNTRVTEFFDHYLKDGKKPDWMK